MTDWNDPEAPWWAKARRARTHIAEVRLGVEAFEREKPWSVEEGTGRTATETAFILRVARPVPADLVTVVGDAVHNLRSSLDCVAYELAVRHVGTSLSEKQEQACSFPIMKDATEFDAFFDAHRLRRDLYGPQERAAMRCVQPFAIGDDARAMGVDWSLPPEQELRQSALYRIHRLSIIGKHRRLLRPSWHPDVSWWTNPPGGSSYVWSQAATRMAFLEDGTVLGYLDDPCGSGPPQIDVHHDVRLGLTDDPASQGPLVETLGSWLGSLTGWVFLSVFVVADGGPPPIGFF